MKEQQFGAADNHSDYIINISFYPVLLHDGHRRIPNKSTATKTSTI